MQEACAFHMHSLFFTTFKVQHSAKSPGMTKQSFHSTNYQIWGENIVKTLNHIYIKTNLLIVHTLLLYTNIMGYPLFYFLSFVLEFWEGRSRLRLSDLCWLSTGLTPVDRDSSCYQTLQNISLKSDCVIRAPPAGTCERRGTWRWRWNHQLMEAHPTAALRQ